jgi:hypothetical protein
MAAATTAAGSLADILASDLSKTSNYTLIDGSQGQIEFARAIVAKLPTEFSESRQAKHLLLAQQHGF